MPLSFWMGLLTAALVGVAIAAWHFGYDEVGVASWYGPGFHGKRTASGEIYDMYAMTAAHKTLPFDTVVRVTDFETGRSVVVRINDRGPFIKGRIIDLSFEAARRLGLSGQTPQDTGRGITRVGLKVLRWGPRNRDQDRGRGAK